MTELIVFRALQGLGAAGIFSMAFTVIADLFPPAERGRYNGLFGAVFGTSSIIGPLLGGFLTDTLSWRWVFYVNMPVGLVALLFILFQMPALKPTLERKVRIDWWGSAALLLGIIPILLALSIGGTEIAWGSWQIIGLFGLGAVGVVIFILIERNAEEPILPFDMFQNRTYVVGNIGALLIAGIGFFGAIIFLPIYMVMVVGVSASAAGLTLMPMTLGMVVASFLSGQIVSRLGKYKLVLLAGAALMIVGYATMLALNDTMTRAQVTWRMILLGVGLGPALPVFTLAIQNSVNPREIGAATSSSQFFRQIGSTIGVAVFGTLMAATLATELPRAMPAQLREAGLGKMSFSMGQLQSGNMGAVGDQIKAGMNDVYKKVELAMTRNDAAALAGLLSNPLLPAQAKSVLQGWAAGPARSPGDTRVALAGIKAAFGAQAVSLTSGLTSGLKKAFTAAIHRVYLLGLLILTAGFVVTLFLPELALRKTAGHAAPASAEG
jgi:MFS family permease